jgi:hypothetical protein
MTMVRNGKVDTQYKQRGNSCVLGSYAIVSKYFTASHISDVFRGYCDHFAIKYNSWREAEQRYELHFDAEWKKRNCTGYQLIIDLHETSITPVFASCRSKFNAKFYVDAGQALQTLEDALRTSESFLNLTFEIASQNQAYHSITVFCGAEGMFSRDTTKNAIHRLNNLASVGRLRDAVLYTKK